MVVVIESPVLRKQSIFRQTNFWLPVALKLHKLQTRSLQEYIPTIYVFCGKIIVAFTC